MAAFEIVVAAESESDARRIKALVDATLIAEFDWLGEQPVETRLPLLDGLRRWRGLDESETFLDVHDVHKLANRRGLPDVPGRFDGRRAAQDYRSVVRALWLMTDCGRPDAFVWVRDTDGYLARVDGWRDACASAGANFSVLLGGFPNECIEAWLLTAWSPSRAREPQIRELRQQLGFNPTKQPERLSHKNNVPKSAKAVCSALGVDEDNWLDGDANDLGSRLSDLAQRGVGCGLADFVETIRERLVPVIRRGV